VGPAQTCLPVSGDGSHEVHGALLPAANPLQEVPVGRAQQQGVALLVLRPPQLQHAQCGVSFLLGERRRKTIRNALAGKKEERLHDTLLLLRDERKALKQTTGILVDG